MSDQNTSTTQKIMQILVSSLGAGLLAYILYQLVSLLDWPEPITLGLPVFIAVVVASITTSAWKKGLPHLRRPDYTKSIASGVGALIGLLLAYFLF